MLGHLVEHAIVYPKLHTRKDDTPVNPKVANNIASIDIFAQVFGYEHNGHVWDVGFGPTPSRQIAKNTTASAQIRNQERDVEVTQLKSQVTFLMEKMARYENLEE
nr:hypothetical protein CFP56_36639 [Quercus suber]